MRLMRAWARNLLRGKVALDAGRRIVGCGKGSMGRVVEDMVGWRKDSWGLDLRLVVISRSSGSTTNHDALSRVSASLNSSGSLLPLLPYYSFPESLFMIGSSYYG